MAEYLLLIYEEETRSEHVEPDTFNEMMAGHREFGEKYHASIRGGNALQPTSTATSVRRDTSGSMSVTDGAFVETKEALGGYYLVEASDLDEALRMAKEIPAPFGGVEVRPIRVFG